MKLSNIKPDKTLIDLLSGKVKVGTAGLNVSLYRPGDVPSNNKEDDFIIIENNGTITSITKDNNCLSGNIMLTYYCRLNANGTVKYGRIDKILDQIESACSNQTYEGVFFSFNRRNLIMSPTANYGIGYSTVIANIVWHTK